jgi:glycosyltransferase involved in cell wall biosynthesis
VHVESGGSSLPSVLILNWRNTRNPEGGGSELYAEQVAAALVRRGHKVTIFCAAHTNAPLDEVNPDGVRMIRGGGRLSVYGRAALAYLGGRLGRADVVIDVQNGLPFLARLYARRPVVVLVHHVHREQWRVVLGPLAARLGWWVESKFSPWVHRRCQYVTVSEVSRDELVELGVDRERIAIVHNGTPEVAGPPRQRSATPTLLVLGRLVPHKQVEVAIRTLAALSDEHPDAELVIAGRGWWLDPLKAEAERLGVAHRVRFAGFVTDAEKHDLLAQSWLHLAPSLKEGWGLSVMEAAAHGTPSVAFRFAGGVAESVVDGQTGYLADDEDEFVARCRGLLGDDAARAEMGAAARAHAASFSWDETGKRFASVLDEVVPAPHGSPIAARH